MVREAPKNPPLVLLVESAEDDRAMYGEYLRLQDFNSIACDNSAEGLALAPKADVIVTGIRVHGPYDGVELVRRLREGDATRTKPVVVLTACALPADEQRARAAGCDSYLTKPCLPDALVAEIRRVLALRAVPRGRPLHAGENRPRGGRRLA